MMNAQYEEDIFKERERLNEVLKIEASREAKRSQCLETNILCVSIGTNNEEGQYANIVIEDEGRGKTLNSILGEDETTESHVHAHTQLSESNDFQLTVKAENQEYLEHDDDQELKETKKDIKYSSVILEAAERKDNEYFLSPIEDLEQP